MYARTNNAIYWLVLLLAVSPLIEYVALNVLTRSWAAIQEGVAGHSAQIKHGRQLTTQDVYLGRHTPPLPAALVRRGATRF
jgi:hypothetical protein